MGILLATIMALAVIAFISNAFVDGYVDGKNVNKWEMVIYKVIVCTILFGGLMVLSKCGCASGYEYSPSGKTTLEHYEPR